MHSARVHRLLEHIDIYRLYETGGLGWVKMVGQDINHSLAEKRKTF